MFAYIDIYDLNSCAHDYEYFWETTIVFKYILH